MSEPGQSSPPAPAILNTKWRDIVSVFGECARPFSIYISSISLAIGALFTLKEDANRLAALGILAGVVTGVSFFRSQDKQKEIQATVGKQ